MTGHLSQPLRDLPPWAVMWTLAMSIYFASKWLTWRSAAVRSAPLWKHVAYLVAWPGLDAASFVEAPARAETSRCRRAEWLHATGQLACGIVLMFGVARVVARRSDYVAGWTGMIAIVLFLHFGTCHLLSCVFRAARVSARPIMNRPLASTSLGEFWGQRWNTAFRDLTYRYIFRPCTSWFGSTWGTVAGFLFSGLVHDLVISVPAQRGYGGPSLFFVIQGTALIVERSAFGRAVGLGRGSRGRLFTIVILVAPIGLLFHRAFVIGVVVPFMRAIGALDGAPR